MTTKERPILFSGPMVRALLDGSKTQTRRAIKPQPPEGTYQVSTWHHPDPRPHFYAWQDLPHDTAMAADGWFHPCPYGQPGDRLWVREAWSTHASFDRYSPSELTHVRSFHYWADGDVDTGKKRPSIHMPRWASRILLEIVSVRVERLQAISETDAEAEGVGFLRSVPDVDETLTAKQLYDALWDSINGAGSWDANPWVWAVEFKVVRA